MRPDSVARRYARALFGLAERQGTLDVVAAGLATAVGLLEDPRTARVLTGPVARAKKQALLHTIADKAGAPPIFRNLLLLLTERDRLDHLAAIRLVFEQLVDRRLGRTRAVVRSARPLPPDMFREITDAFGKLTGKQVLAEVAVDPELLAGVIVEVEGRVYDGSLRTQLSRLCQQMAAGS